MATVRVAAVAFGGGEDGDKFDSFRAPIFQDIDGGNGRTAGRQHRIEEEDQVKGLMIGGDDYLTQPVSPQVILAHVKAVLRRSGVEESKTLQVDGLTIYEDEYRASLDGKDLGLTLTEFELVRYLVRHPRKAFTRQQLLETIWKDAMMVTERTVDAHIKNLREKLGSFARHIQTVRGVGYRFVNEPEEEQVS